MDRSSEESPGDLARAFRLRREAAQMEPAELAEVDRETGCTPAEIAVGNQIASERWLLIQAVKAMGYDKCFRKEVA